MGKYKILLVEDDFVYSYVLDNYLTEYGDFKVTTVSSGEDCLKMMVNKPDVVILDYNLETMNGLETFKAIKKLNSKVPVIILSGQKDLQVAADLLKMGAFDYLEKGSSKKSVNWLIDPILKSLHLK
jgi:two-component system, NtrC family, response regulator AtoC